MIMVIFGAGASYDSVPSRPPSRYIRQHLFVRPPLATELFLDQDFFADCLRQFPQCKPIVPYLQSIPPDSTVEHIMETLQAEGDNDPERKRQIAAVRFYLHFMIWECERRWNDVAHGITNYVTLLDQLRRCRSPREPVLLVTFNYDRMIEQALLSVGITIADLPDYISHDSFKLFKLHGSTHWAREVDNLIADVKDRNVWQVGSELIDKAAELKVTDRYRIVTTHPIGKIDEIPVFPAIAMPVETKHAFECPADHLASLCSHLGQVRRILIVGWRATEKHFLALLKENLSPDVSFQAVAGHRDYAEEALGRIRDAGIPGSSEPAAGGFTEYTVSREAERFFGAQEPR